jgi:hypothetical protein
MQLKTPSTSPNLLMWTVFYDCNFNCDFCFVRDERTLPGSEAYSRFNDLTFHDGMIDFFDMLSEKTGKWTILLTGGEPLLMPNLAYLTDKLIDHGHLVRYNTNLSISIETNRGWRDANPPEGVDAFVVSIHPQSLPQLNSIINRVKVLKQIGYPIIVRMVAHPDRIHLLKDLDCIFRDIDISFSPLPLLTGGYPRAYTKEQFVLVRQLMKGYTELLCLYGGVNMTKRKCFAGSRTLYIQSTSDTSIGLIHPCISVAPSEVLKNFLGPKISKPIDNMMSDSPIDCVREKPLCNCPALFEYNIVEGCETRKQYDLLRDGYVKPVWEQFERWIQEKNITFFAPPDYIHEIGI